MSNKIRKIFGFIDTNKSGTISKFELKKFLNLKDMKIVNEIFEASDINKDDEIQFEEFIQALKVIID